jgi:AhpD family alkylhydroperoxidase
MAERINAHQVAPDAYQAMGALQHFVNQSTLPRELLELARMRASQINGCAYCMDMHSKDAMALGIPAQKLFVLDAWREAPFYTDRERAALEWTEAVTLIAEHQVPDAVYQAVQPHFSDRELIELTMTIITINGWNRLAISFRQEVGTYQSHLSPEPVGSAS